MPLRVYTARVSYGGPDRLDITRKSATPEGLIFAPSIEFLKKRNNHVKHNVYIAEMRVSYTNNPAGWAALLARDEVTLCCSCVDPANCHRVTLAQYILTKLGAQYLGERPKPEPRTKKTREPLPPTDGPANTEEAMDLLERTREYLIECGKVFAVRIALQKGSVHSCEMRQEMVDAGILAGYTGKDFWVGAVFTSLKNACVLRATGERHVYSDASRNTHNATPLVWKLISGADTSAWTDLPPRPEWFGREDEFERAQEARDGELH